LSQQRSYTDTYYSEPRKRTDSKDQKNPTSVFKATAPAVIIMGVLVSLNDRNVPVVTALITFNGAEAANS
jgi:hypothetical protein